MKKILAIIAVYNEEESIGNVIKDIYKVNNIHKLSIDILVINDGSTDNSSQIALDLSCKLINFPKNVGKSYAIHEGIMYALKNNYDYVFQIDGDGQHPINEIPSMIHHMKVKNLDVVIGSRFIHKKGDQSFLLRRMGIKYFNLLLKTFCAIQITDCTSGFKLINKKTMFLISDKCKYKHTEVIMLLHYKKYGLQFEEISVAMNKRHGGKSFFNFRYSLLFMILISMTFIYYSIKKHNNLNSDLNNA